MMLLSVIIPVKNVQCLVKDQLDALANQTYKGDWELIVSDNGSTDHTCKHTIRACSNFDRFKLIDASLRPGAAFARNTGAQAAAGDYFLFLDADDRASSDWLATMAEGAKEHHSIGGRIEPFYTDDKDSIRKGKKPSSRLPTAGLGFLPYAMGANCGVHSEVFKRLGGFNENYLCGEEVEFFWRLQLKGFNLQYIPGAVVHYRERNNIFALAKQYINYGMIAPKLYQDFYHRGMPCTSALNIIKIWLHYLTRTPFFICNTKKRRDWIRTLSYRYGCLLGSLKYLKLYL